MGVSASYTESVFKSITFDYPGNTALTYEIERIMNQLQEMNIMIPKPAKIREYLLKYPDIIELILPVVNDAREAFLGRFMFLDVYEDDDYHNSLVLYIRQESYDEPISEKINEIIKQYKEELAGKSGQIRVATDFEVRFAGLDLDYYRQNMSPEQFKLLIETVGIIPAPNNFDPNETLYPEDL